MVRQWWQRQWQQGWTIRGGRRRNIQARPKEDTGEATGRVERKWSNDAEEEDAEEVEDDKSGEGNASMDEMVRLEGKFKVGTSKTPSDSGALAARFLLKDGKDITF